MAESIVITSEGRKGSGSREAARLRKKGLIPAIIYGHKETPETVAVPWDSLEPALRQRTHSLELQVGGKKQSVLIQDVQYDHLVKDVLHVDFLRVSATDRIHVTVPIELRGTPTHAKGGAGVLIQPLHNLHIECLVSARPESIRIKIDDLQLGQAIHVRELQVPEGVKILHDGDAVVVQLKVPTVQAEVAPAAPIEGESAEPEIITKKVKDKEETEEK
jgi:large subunit ribosomal protein L25